MPKGVAVRIRAWAWHETHGSSLGSSNRFSDDDSISSSQCNSDDSSKQSTFSCANACPKYSAKFDSIGPTIDGTIGSHSADSNRFIFVCCIFQFWWIDRVLQLSSVRIGKCVDLILHVGRRNVRILRRGHVFGSVSRGDDDRGER